MRTKLAFIAWASVAISTPAQAQTGASVALTPGESVALSVAGKEAARVVRRGRGEWTPHDLSAARHLVGRPIPDAPVPTADALPSDPDAPQVPPVERGIVNLRFMTIADRHALLIVENGYGEALLYRARMTQGGNTRPTDVCVVLPANRGYEHWPHPIDRLELTDFALVPWRQGDTPTCE